MERALEGSASKRNDTQLESHPGPTAESLRYRVRAAFPDRSHSGDDSLLEEQPGARSAGLEEAWDFFRGRSWSEVLEEGDGVTLRDTLSFLSWDGLAYYLPALALLSVDVADPGAVDDPLVRELRSSPEQIAARLDPAQRRATVHLLEYLAGEYRRWPATGDPATESRVAENPAQEALDEYWASFARPRPEPVEKDADRGGVPTSL